MRIWPLAALLLAPARAADFAGKPARPSPADAALCAGLGQSDDRLRAAFRDDSDFPDQVGAAFAGQGSGEATAGSYLARGRDLFAFADSALARCRAAFDYASSNNSPAEAAAVRRRAQGAKRDADLYLDLPRILAEIDAAGSPAEAPLRPRFLRAMYLIADGGDYAAARVLADAASAQRRRARR